MDCWSLSVTETHPLLSAPHTDVLKKVGWERGTAEPSTLRPLNGVTVAVLPRRPPHMTDFLGSIVGNQYLCRTG